MECGKQNNRIQLKHFFRNKFAITRIYIYGFLKLNLKIAVSFIHIHWYELIKIRHKLFLIWFITALNSFSFSFFNVFFFN